MNAKTCKKLRAKARRLGADPADAVRTMNNVNFAIVETGELELDGFTKKTKKVPYTGTITLDPLCGRAVYHRMKELAK